LGHVAKRRKAGHHVAEIGLVVFGAHVGQAAGPLILGREEDGVGLDAQRLKVAQAGVDLGVVLRVRAPVVRLAVRVAEVIVARARTGP
jgi:hypothetical protein